MLATVIIYALGASIGTVVVFKYENSETHCFLMFLCIHTDI
jgi:hypothetical protein